VAFEHGIDRKFSPKEEPPRIRSLQRVAHCITVLSCQGIPFGPSHKKTVPLPKQALRHTGKKKASRFPAGEKRNIQRTFRAMEEREFKIPLKKKAIGVVVTGQKPIAESKLEKGHLDSELPLGHGGGVDHKYKVKRTKRGIVGHFFILAQQWKRYYNPARGTFFCVLGKNPNQRGYGGH